MIDEQIAIAENETDDNQISEFEPPADWDGIPRAYLHVDCGTVTQVSDDIISNYLADPYFYSSGDTICASCGIVADKNCVWTETGEHVDQYMERLKATKDTNYHLVRWGLPFLCGIIGSFVLPMFPGKVQLPPGVPQLLGFFMGLLPGFYIAKFPRLLLCKMRIIYACHNLTANSTRGQLMSKETPNLGPELGRSKSIPEYIQVILSVAALAQTVALWKFDVASFPVALVGTMIEATALYFLFHRIPALSSSLTVYENGLEMIVQGKSTSFAFDQLNCLTASFTDHKWKHQYIGTQARIEFFLDGRFSPFVYKTEFRRNRWGEKLMHHALQKCSEAIEHRLLAELEQKGAVRWRDNASLTADGILLTEPIAGSRLIPYRQIGDWKIVDNDLKIWKAGDALPCLVLKNDTPNFVPLCGLFESLAAATHNLDPTCLTEPDLVATQARSASEPVRRLPVFCSESHSA